MKKSIDINRDTINEWLNESSSPGKEELKQAEEALNRFASAYAVRPDPGLKDKVMDKIKSLNAEYQNKQHLSFEDLPLLSETSNWMEWEELVKDIQPPQHFEGIHLHSLESSDKRELFVAWVKEYIEEEVHFDILESFILLEGTCECHITDAQGNARVVRMGVGDYITMQVGETHDVIITSLEPAKAILQWMKLSA